jgi:hypothetical protein
MSVLIRRNDRSRSEPDPWIFLHIEIRILPKMIVPQIVVGIHRSGIDADIETIRGYVLRIKNDRTL